MKKIFFLFIIITTISCHQNESSFERNKIQTEETPKVLQETKFSAGDLVSYSSMRWEENLIDGLFEEAQENNKTLKDWVKEYDNLIKQTVEKTEMYNNYKAINKEYWSSADNFRKMIKDSLLQNKMRETIDLANLQYQENLKKVTDEITLLERKSTVLEDRLSVLKLTISLEMMRAYQINELPSITAYEALIKQYDQLIEESKNIISNPKLD